MLPGSQRLRHSSAAAKLTTLVALHVMRPFSVATGGIVLVLTYWTARSASQSYSTRLSNWIVSSVVSGKCGSTPSKSNQPLKRCLLVDSTASACSGFFAASGSCLNMASVFRVGGTVGRGIAQNSQNVPQLPYSDLLQ